MERIFYLGPRFGARPQKGPKIEKWIPPTVFELGPSFFSGIIGYQWANKIIERSFHLGPVLGLGPKGPKNRKMNSSYSF